jgi:hypothetical protein
MPAGLRSRHALVAVWAVLLGLDLVALLPLRTWPFVDLPNHLAEATVFKYRNQPSLPLGRYYASAVSLEKPNIAHIVLCSIFPSVEDGNRVLYGAYIVALPLLTLLIVRRLKGDVWVALLSQLLLWNFSVTWGFSGFTLAIPLVLLGHYVHLGSLTTPTPRRSLALLSLIFPAIYWFHVLPLGLALFSFALIELWRYAKRRSLPSLLLRLTPAIPVLVLMTVWIVTGGEFRNRSDGSFYADYYLHRYLASIPQRIGGLFARDNDAIYAERLGRIVATLLAAPIFLPLVLSLIRRHRGALEPDAGRAATLTFTLAALAAYAFLPNAIPDQNFLYQRFGVFVLLGCVMTLSVSSQARRIVYPRPWIVLAVTVHAAVWLRFFVGFGSIAQDFSACFPRDEGSRDDIIATIPFDVDYRGRPSLAHYANYQIIWNLGVAPTRVIEYRFGAIRAASARLPKFADFVAEDVRQRSSLPSIITQYASCDGLLVRGAIPAALLDHDPAYDRVQATSQWVFYRKRSVGGRASP